MCNNFEEVIKGQSNRELLSDFNNLIGSEIILTLGPELGAYHIKPRNATDAQQWRALEVIIQGMILEKKLEGTRQEEKMEVLMESDKFEGIVDYVLGSSLRKRDVRLLKRRRWSSPRKTYLRCRRTAGP